MEELINKCRQNGLRITTGLRTILEVLHQAALPMSLQELEVNPAIIAICDRATIFRTLQRLEGIGMLRRLNFSHSGAKFSLSNGDNHEEYLICTACGEITTLNMSCPVHKIQDDVINSTGYKQMSHELTFYGVCPACQ